MTAATHPVEHPLLRAGKFTWTVVNNATGKRYTFRVERSQDQHPRWGYSYFVSYLNGPDNESSYRYLGLLIKRSGGRLVNGEVRDVPYSELRTTRATNRLDMRPDAPVRKALQYSVDVLEGVRTAHPDCSVLPSNQCARCGRKLTTPESIRRGIGPECAEMVNS